MLYICCSFFARRAKNEQQIERQVASSVSMSPDGRVAGVSMRACGLPEFPALLRRLPELEQIDLSGNRIAALPAWVADLARLNTLLLDDNQLGASCKTTPAAICDEKFVKCSRTLS